MELERGNNRKSKKGTVISNSMEKTVIVRVDRTQRHPKYGKAIVRSKKYYAHDESDALEVGQVVEIVETRPLSKLKRWRVLSVAPQN